MLTFLGIEVIHTAADAPPLYSDTEIMPGSSLNTHGFLAYSNAARATAYVVNAVPLPAKYSVPIQSCMTSIAAILLALQKMIFDFIM